MIKEAIMRWLGVDPLHAYCHSSDALNTIWTPLIQGSRARIRDLEAHTALLESRIAALERSLDARMWPLEHPTKGIQ